MGLGDECARFVARCHVRLFLGYVCCCWARGVVFCFFRFIPVSSVFFGVISCDYLQSGSLPFVRSLPHLQCWTGMLSHISSRYWCDDGSLCKGQHILLGSFSLLGLGLVYPGIYSICKCSFFVHWSSMVYSGFMVRKSRWQSGSNIHFFTQISCVGNGMHFHYWSIYSQTNAILLQVCDFGNVMITSFLANTPILAVVPFTVVRRNNDIWLSSALF